MFDEQFIRERAKAFGIDALSDVEMQYIKALLTYNLYTALHQMPGYVLLDEAESRKKVRAVVTDERMQQLELLKRYPYYPEWKDDSTICRVCGGTTEQRTNFSSPDGFSLCTVCGMKQP